MTGAEKKWRILSASVGDTDALQRTLNIHPLLCRILVQRGVLSFEAAKKFFRPSIDDRHDPFTMKDMPEAVDRIIKAMERKEKILVYGDYDVDGTTSVAIMFDFLSSIYDREMLEYYIPNRYKEGYGLSQQGIDHASLHGFSLLITIDCGIKSVALIEEAKRRGIDTIVCDHHLPGKSLPPAVAILNAKQESCPYPFKELCACGVAFKLIEALATSIGLDESSFMKYLELVAVAIAADIVPITGENRTLAFEGMKIANSTPSVGIKALLEQGGMTKKINIGSLSFMIGPRINAAGRMDDAKKAVSLFIEKDYVTALEIAAMLNQDNKSRREADASITEQAIKLIRNDPGFSKKKSTVVFQKDWHKGVIGIVASRLLEKFYRPTIVLTQSGDVLSGSARSIPGLNIHDALEECSDLLIGFGGHYFAAGMTMPAENLLLFKERFEQVASSILSDSAMVPEILIDTEVLLKDITPSFFSILEQMEPFGPENSRPVFCARNLRNTGTRIVKEDHVRFEVEQAGIRLTGIGFNMAEKLNALHHPDLLDIVFHLEENRYRDQISLQMKVIDFDMAGKK